MNIRKAAIYLRSSKDRNDVSIDAQRRELRALATAKDIVIVQEYVDTVESGKDANRRGFQQLIADMRSKKKEWNCLLMVDTSRLSRRRYTAQVFKHDAKKFGVEILYSKVPETDPITSVLLDSVFEAIDELHSLMSREKGLAGMAENVAQGYRAGGRAPAGYKLKYIETGAIREGAAVRKSMLEPSKDAPLAKRYLKARAAGQHRSALKRELKLPWSQSTLIYMEWAALTYAGHTVWNVHNEFNGGYKNGTRRRPRSEWRITRNTHPALITDEEAEVLLVRLESRPTTRRTAAKYLLSGILKSPNGITWFGDGGGVYRLKDGKTSRIKAAKIEDAVIDRVIRDMGSDQFADQLIAYGKQYNATYGSDPAADLRIQEKNIKAQISKLVLLASKLEDSAPAAREIDNLERQRKFIETDIKRLETEYMASQAFAKITRHDVKNVLKGVLEELKTKDRESLKDLLLGLIEEVELDPATGTGIIRYRLGNKMASPRGYDLIPLKAETVFNLTKAA